MLEFHGRPKFSMPAPVKKLPPLEELQKIVRLSDAYPSGLEWALTDRWREEGGQAGTLSRPNPYYVVRLLGTKYVAHRVVHYLRTGRDTTKEILHLSDNPERDNRRKLVEHSRGSKKPT